MPASVLLRVSSTILLSFHEAVLDAQFSPDIATWIAEHFAVEAVPVRDAGLRDAADVEIFTAAKQARVVVFITLATAAQQAAGTDRNNSRNRGYYSLKARPPRFP